MNGSEQTREYGYEERRPTQERPDLNYASDTRDAGPLRPAGGSEKDARLWAMFLHLSQLANYVLPPAGVIVPIVLWQIKKDELPGLDAHGKVVVNWIISSVIYAFVCFLLAFVIIGIPLLIGLGVLCVVFPIIGGIKANNGEVWKYPLSIEFLK